MTKNDMASVSKNDGGAAKTRLDGESAAGDDELALLLDALRAPSFEQDSIWHGPKAIYATKPRALLTQAAEALTSLRTELDEARADQSRAEIRFGNALARAEGDRRAAEARALKAEAENKALRQALTAGWRPIESAPKDGTHILVTEAHRGGLGHCGPVNQHGFRDPADWCDVVHWFNDPDEPGFYSTSWGGDQEHPFANLTHWMPLPSPPSESQ